LSEQGVGCGRKLFSALAAFTAFSGLPAFTAFAAVAVAAAAFTRGALAGVASLGWLSGVGIGLGCGITFWGVSALGAVAAFGAVCAPTARPVAPFAAACTGIAFGGWRAVCTRSCVCRGTGG
jgi:hypothetical protein